MIGAGCVMEHEPTGTILCVQRDRADYNKGEWELPYGRIAQHEDILEGLKREIFEETGKTDFEVRRLLRIWHFYRGEKKAETEIHGCTFHCVTQSQDLVLSPEHSQLAWLKPELALEKIAIVGVREDVRFFIENRDTQKVAFSGVSNLINTII
jgi:8-oxo-dGTP pyrophosphatase MutT (NUDIX family)